MEIPINLGNVTLRRYARYYPNTLKEIQNAWSRHAVIDNVGYIWVALKGFRSILRLGNTNANEFYDFEVPDLDKRIIDGERYVRSTVIVAKLNNNISSGAYSLSKRNYSKYSKALFTEYNEHPYLENIRANFLLEFKRKKKKLRNDRIVQFGLLNDELTGTKLNFNTCEFSHIRSVEMYPELALFVWNGLIVNRETHKVITRRQSQTEESLLKMCSEKGWSRRWLGRYQFDLGEFGYGALV